MINRKALALVALCALSASMPTYTLPRWAKYATGIGGVACACVIFAKIVKWWRQKPVVRPQANKAAWLYYRSDTQEHVLIIRNLVGTQIGGQQWYALDPALQMRSGEQLVTSVPAGYQNISQYFDNILQERNAFGGQYWLLHEFQGDDIPALSGFGINGRVEVLLGLTKQYPPYPPAPVPDPRPVS